MITLYLFPPAFGMTNASPFALKLEAYCKLAKIEYKVEYRLDSNKMPNKKLPVAMIEGEQVADSHFILESLEAQYKLDSELTAKQHALGFLLKELAEEKLYWSLVYSRWLDDDFWPTTRIKLFSKLPRVVQLFIPAFVRKGIKKAAFGQGLSRHSKEDVYHLAEQAITHLSNQLGDDKFFVCDRMTQYDCSIYAVLTNMLNGQLNTPLKASIENHKNLVEYIQSCRQHSGV